jgi:hypothetical protein
MDADQGFRKAPGSLLRIAAGAGAAALIVTAVPVPSLPTDAAGPWAPSGPLTTATAQTTPDVRPRPYRSTSRSATGSLSSAPATGFTAGHRLRLNLTSDDQDPKFPAEMNFRHASVGTSSLNRIASGSRLLLPVAAGTP